ncbi:DUF3040 domain-containing protein [Actinomadura viridis]|uniref:DUF3040 domain-containing protein n=1 Tax=Actinomadura viridis TaxID=58110 RepID=UPI0036BF22FD
MALSMEEQRILAQIEVHLSEDDPRLAHRFSRLERRPRRNRPLVVAAVVLAVLAVAALAAFS